jgi:hypothetical protein
MPVPIRKHETQSNMDLMVVEEDTVKVVEGHPDAAFMVETADAGRVIEACLSNGTDAALLYAENLTGGFFDLSSGQAGEILQKLRNYGVRLAVVCPPGRVAFSSRFGEMLTEERRGHTWRVRHASAAREWLARRQPASPIPSRKTHTSADNLILPLARPSAHVGTMRSASSVVLVVLAVLAARTPVRTQTPDTSSPGWKHSR